MMNTEDSKWHDAVLGECMKVEACYYPDDPIRSVKELIDWYVVEERGLTDGIKIMKERTLACLKAFDGISTEHILNMPHPVIDMVESFQEVYDENIKLRQLMDMFTKGI